MPGAEFSSIAPLSDSHTRKGAPNSFTFSGNRSRKIVTGAPHW